MLNIFKPLQQITKPAKRLHITHDSGGKDKDTLVLLHGIAATSKTWDTLLPHLDPKKYRVITMDLLGFGESPKPTNVEYDVETHTKSIKKTISRLNIKKPYYLVGHSMGSIIATHYAFNYPDEVQEVYLISLPLYLKDGQYPSKRSKTETDLYKKAYRYIRGKKNFTIKHSQRLIKILKIPDGADVNEDNWNAFKESLDQTIIHQNTYEEILRLPSKQFHLLQGSLDEFMVKDSLNMLAELPNVSSNYIRGVDHALSPKFAKKIIKTAK